MSATSGGSEITKWQSKLFPQLILTEDHYREMRKLFPNIVSFKVEMEKLEKWLWANEDRRPKSRWKKQINNWMRIADEMAKKEHERRLIKGKERPMTHREAAQSLGEILKRKE